MNILVGLLALALIYAALFGLGHLLFHDPNPPDAEPQNGAEIFFGNPFRAATVLVFLAFAGIVVVAMADGLGDWILSAFVGK